MKSQQNRIALVTKPGGMQPPFDVMMSAPTYGNLEPHNLYFPGIGWQKNVVFTKCHTNSVLVSIYVVLAEKYVKIQLQFLLK